MKIHPFLQTTYYIGLSKFYIADEQPIAIFRPWHPAYWIFFLIFYPIVSNEFFKIFKFNFKTLDKEFIQTPKRISMKNLKIMLEEYEIVNRLKGINTDE